MGFIDDILAGQAKRECGFIVMVLHGFDLLSVQKKPSAFGL
jgi:hypothetical protein